MQKGLEERGLRLFNPHWSLPYFGGFKKCLFTELQQKEPRFHVLPKRSKKTQTAFYSAYLAAMTRVSGFYEAEIVIHFKGTRR